MSDFPDMLPSSKRAARDRIELALADMDWSEQAALRIEHHHARRMLAGAVCKAFMTELARMRETEATLARLRRVIRSGPEAGAIPTRKLLDALYGEERR